MTFVWWKFIVSFLVGAIPFAKVAMVGTGIDITKVGSKNPGFNNVLRVSSKWRAAIALIGDISKGSIALLALGASCRSELRQSWDTAGVRFSGLTAVKASPPRLAFSWYWNRKSLWPACRCIQSFGS